MLTMVTRAMDQERERIDQRMPRRDPLSARRSRDQGPLSSGGSQALRATPGNRPKCVALLRQATGLLHIESSDGAPVSA